jgi:hypothetical protein
MIGFFGDAGNGGQFLAFVTGSLPFKHDPNWQREKRWHALLHIFDREGNHLETKHYFAGCTADGQRTVVERAKNALEEMLEALPSRIYCDVAVKLFRVSIDGRDVGLMNTSHGKYEQVTLWPNDLAFHAPWDGYYDT